ncbi:MAG: flavin reductase family protein [Mycobacteriaceae bacterium]|uniref:flavin reductase family protein n=1 Tax=Corynebacterium sp. TaxID=1720 RepID=UPI003F9D2415
MTTTLTAAPGKAPRQAHAANGTSSEPTRLPLAVLAAEVHGRMMCVVIDSYFDESLAPGLVSVRVPTDDPAWRELRHAPRLGISVLNPLQTIGVGAVDHLLTTDDHGAGVLDGASVHLTTRLYQEFDAGENTVLLLNVLGRFTGEIAPEQREYLYSAA